MRKTYGLSTIAIHRGGITLGEEQDIRQVPFQAGDTLVVRIPVKMNTYSGRT